MLILVRSGHQLNVVSSSDEVMEESLSSFAGCDLKVMEGTLSRLACDEVEGNLKIFDVQSHAALSVVHREKIP